MSNRDEFPARVKKAVALRANQHCSFRGCPQPTSGPSEESPEATAMIGKAAHIHAAAAGPGARRYLASMTRAERTHINNAIWLCSKHADLIDDDETTYTADSLREMKREHEANCKKRLENAVLAGEFIPDLIAVGPDIVSLGDFLGIDNDQWSFHLRSFVDGDIHAFIAFIENYDKTAVIDRYVLVNFLGDGRVLRDKPTFTREKTGGYIVRCPLQASADRIRAHDLPKSWALSESHDLMTRNGQWAMVSGLEALPQQVKTCLSHMKGESPIYRDAGTRFSEYCSLFSGSRWFDRLLKLELIRQAAIPYVDSHNNRSFTPLQCVERVHELKILADSPVENWLPISVDLDVKGIGRWQHSLSICVPREPVARWSLEKILSGPCDRLR